MLEKWEGCFRRRKRVLAFVVRAPLAPNTHTHKKHTYILIHLTVHRQGRHFLHGTISSPTNIPLPPPSSSSYSISLCISLNRKVAMNLALSLSPTPSLSRIIYLSQVFLPEAMVLVSMLKNSICCEKSF